MDDEPEQPLALQSLPEEVETAIEKVVKIIREDVDEKSLEKQIENTLTPSEIEDTKRTYEELQKTQGLLHHFTETQILTPIRNGMFGYKNNEQILRAYTVIAREGMKIHEITQSLQRREFERFCSADDSLAKEIARVAGIDAIVTLSFMQYIPRSYDQRRQAVCEAAATLAKLSRNPGKTRERERIEKKLKETKRELREFERGHGILWVGTRVKGAENLAYKIADKIVGLDDLVKANKQVVGEHPTTIKDILGVKIIVNGDSGKEEVIDYLHKQEKELEQLRFLQEAKDYWRSPKIEDKRVVYQGWKNVIIYCDTPIEIQIQTQKMYEQGEADHTFHYRERQMQRRWVATQMGIPYLSILQTVSRLFDLPIDEQEAEFWLSGRAWNRRQQRKLIKELGIRDNKENS